jgi:hypothetical protein
MSESYVSEGTAVVWVDLALPGASSPSALVVVGVYSSIYVDDHGSLVTND